MSNGEVRWRLDVPTAGDTLRRERLVLDMHNTLLDVDGWEVELQDGEPSTEAGRKGAAGDLSLWAVAAGLSRPAAQVLIALVKEWCAKDRHRKVEVTWHGASFTVTGGMDESQERAIDNFLDKVQRAETSETGGEGE